MNFDQLCQAERNRIEKMHLQLPNVYKKIGIIAFVLSMSILISTKFIGEEIDSLKPYLKQIVIASMLMIAISKEKIEDEMIMKIRLRAFSISFIWTVIYALVQPYVNYGVASIISADKAILEEFGSFIILWFMLTVYLLYFHVMKRMA